MWWCMVYDIMIYSMWWYHNIWVVEVNYDIYRVMVWDLMEGCGVYVYLFTFRWLEMVWRLCIASVWVCDGMWYWGSNGIWYGIYREMVLWYEMWYWGRVIVWCFVYDSVCMFVCFRFDIYVRCIYLFMFRWICICLCLEGYVNLFRFRWICIFVYVGWRVEIWWGRVVVRVYGYWGRVMVCDGEGDGMWYWW